MATRAPCTPFGKKMKIATVEQDTPQQELVRRLGITNSTVSDIIYGRNQCERTKGRIAKTLGIKGQAGSGVHTTGEWYGLRSLFIRQHPAAP